MSSRPQSSERVAGTWSIATLLGAAVLVLVPYGLLLRTLPIGRDSGVFVYTGMIMNSGGMPYVDSWDHKGPLLYIFNALGYLLTDSAKGIILLEGLLLFAGLAISMSLWRRLLPTFAVVLAATLFVLTYCATFELGNLTESWLIPFILVTYSLAFAYFCDESVSNKVGLLDWLCISLGIAMAVAMLTRLNNGMGLGFLALYLVVFGTRHRFRSIVLMGVSYAVVVLPILFWLYQKGAMSAFVEQYWSFNFAYSRGASLVARVVAMYSLSQAIFLSPLGLGCLLMGAAVLLSNTQVPKGKKNSFYWLMFTIFCVELLSQLASGRGYLHYASLAAPALALVFVALLNLGSGPGGFLSGVRKNAKWAVLVVPAFVVASAPPAFAMLGSLKHGTGVAGSPENELADYLQRNTKPSDFVLVHGAETWLLAASGRRSATSITYYYPALSGFKDTHEKYQADTLGNKPLYIVEAPDSCGLAKSKCEGQPELFAKLRDFLQKEYVQERDLHGYRFWRYRGAKS
ncbi:hypothetical protein QTI24_05200 [Variovorax sp. J22P240]|uniref:hypothetical protein n=1 Tax=Variovorax sp. J22P240 TaxID=3053514 RepID=UPI002574C449|nr:hypothetical protein [Variovorax sp. J22P240]MDL9997990.1 hypothetical protein [Variovorax sp. J22P240]